MDKEKVNARIDKAAEQAKETMDLLNDKLDEATHCTDEKAQRIKDSAKETAVRTADRVEEAVSKAADKVREKVRS